MPDHHYTWGIDIGIKRVDIATIKDDEVNLHQVQVVHDKGADRAEKLARLQLALIPSLIHIFDQETPFSVWVEQPAGFSRNITLVCAYGTVLTALRLAMANRSNFPVPIYSITPTRWKKGTVGKGNADKNDVYLWATSLGVDGGQDAIDAFCVAYYGARQTEAARA
jgi:Holliday junction resolvasome RuvABC endonuclease subunit